VYFEPPPTGHPDNRNVQRITTPAAATAIATDRAPHVIPCHAPNIRALGGRSGCRQYQAGSIFMQLAKPFPRRHPSVRYSAWAHT
jgi:hypothetical protein